MSILKYIDRLCRMHDLIRRQSTGTSEEFAEKLGLSRSVLMDNMRELKALGARIEYCHARRSYFYEQDFSVIIGHSKQQKIRGGLKNFYYPVSDSAGLMSDIFDINLNFIFYEETNCNV
jgi:hypothetical protein